MTDHETREAQNLERFDVLDPDNQAALYRDLFGRYRMLLAEVEELRHKEKWTREQMTIVANKYTDEVDENSRLRAALEQDKVDLTFIFNALDNDDAAPAYEQASLSLDRLESALNPKEDGDGRAAVK